MVSRRSGVTRERGTSVVNAAIVVSAPLTIGTDAA